MPTPTLIQPAEVIIQPLDRANTKSSSRTRAPIKVIKRSSNVTFEAQIQFNQTVESEPTEAGLVQSTSGYLVARSTDLDTLGYEPKIGDKIITLGPVQGLSLYTTAIQDTAWYSGSPTLKVISFDDRRPSRGGA